MRRQQWVAAILLAVVLVLAGVVVLWKVGRSDEPPPSSPVEPLWELSFAQIQAISIQGPDGVVYRVERDAFSSWVVVSPIVSGTNQSRMEWMVLYLTELHSARRFAPEEVDLEGFGLLPPTAIITLTLRSSEPRVLRIGRMTPRGEAFYLQVDDQVHLGSRAEIGNLLDFVYSPPISPDWIPTSPEIDGGTPLPTP